MSIEPKAYTSYVEKHGEVDQDIEKAEIASPESWTNITTATSANTMSNIAEVEPDRQRLGLYPLRAFLSRIAVIISPHTIATSIRNHCNKKETEKKHLQDLYSQLITQPSSIEGYPPGWPQLAAFLHSEDNFAIFRRFGLTHCRVLVQLQAEIQLLEEELSKLDKDDATSTDRIWRLQMADIEDDRAPYDAAQKRLLTKLQEKLLAYDQLLLYDQKLREMGQAKMKDHRSVYHWIYTEKPLGKDQYNWIYQATDFVPLSKTNKFEYFILNSFFKHLFLSSSSKSKSDSNSPITHYSTDSLLLIAKLLSVLLTVAILIIPIFILLWIPETRAWISATVLISVFAFSALMSLFTEARVQEILVGTAAYCAVLATFLGNTQMR